MRFEVFYRGAHYDVMLRVVAYWYLGDAYRIEVANHNRDEPPQTPYYAELIPYL